MYNKTLRYKISLENKILPYICYNLVTTHAKIRYGSAGRMASDI